MTTFPIIETERLLLRQVNQEEAQDVLIISLRMK